MTEQRYFEDVSVGDTISPVTERTSNAQLFFFSAASNNGHRIHYDRPFAESEGHPNILVQGPLQAALMAKTVQNWGGSRARLLRVRTQNRASAYPDEALVFTGRVTGKREDGGRGIVELEVWEEKDGGVVIMPGSADIELPRRG